MEKRRFLHFLNCLAV